MGRTDGIDYEGLLDWLDHDLVSLDLTTRQIVYVSAPAAARLGLPRDALAWRTISDEDADRLLRGLNLAPDVHARVLAMLSAPPGATEALEYLAPRGADLHWRRMSMRVVDTPTGPRFDIVARDIDDLVRARRERAVAIALRELGDAVFAAPDMAAAGRAVVERVRAHASADRCALRLFEERTRELGGLRAVAGIDAPIPGDRAIADALLERFGLTHHVEDAQSLDMPVLAPAIAQGLRSFAYAVVGSEKEPLGILSVSWTTTHRFTEHELDFIRLVADRVAGPLAQRLLEEERQRAAATLAETTTRLQSALDSSGIGIWEWDPASGKTTCDGVCWDLWELAPGTLDVSSEVRRRVHLDDRAAMEGALARAMDPAGTGSVRSEYRYAAPSGLKHLVVRGAFRFDGSGRPARFLGTLQDVSEARRLEAKLVTAQKLESLGVLAGGIAHDFNNLLVGVLGNAGFAKLELPTDSPLREPIEAIETAALRASELTRQLLAYAGKARFVISSIQLEPMVQEMGRLLGPVVGKGVVLQYRFAPGVPPVRGDATQLRQVIMNLITNASDAIGDRSGTITITTRRLRVDRALVDAALAETTLEPGDYVSLSVTDTGAGMDAATRARIFEPFFTTKFTGRGLGLAAVQGILRGHRGALSVESAPGRGTTFEVLLPVATEAPAVDAPAPPIDTTPSTGSILVIDDEVTMRDLSRRVLGAAGFMVREAADGLSGVEMFRAEHAHIDLVILDVTMPGMGGAETLRRLREIDPAVRVVVASGYSAQEATTQFAGYGAITFVEKPFRATVLLERVRAALQA